MASRTAKTKTGIRAGNTSEKIEFQNTISVDNIRPELFYLVDFDKCLVLQAGPFATWEEGQDSAEKEHIELLSNDYPYSIWNGQSIIDVGVFSLSCDEFE